MMNIWNTKVFNDTKEECTKVFKQKTKIQKMFEHKKKYLKEKFAKDNRTQEK